jgi:RNA polymerase sigma factor (sigma-70 family)
VTKHIVYGQHDTKPNMHPAHPANDNRPESFDAEVLAFRPGLYAYALRKYSDRAEDLVQDTLVAALSRWRSYRPGKAVLPWLKYMLNHVRYKQDNVKRVSVVHTDADAPVAASQEHAASINMALSRTPPRVRSMLLMEAAGHTLAEVGEAHGVTRQRVLQVTKAERLALQLAANDADARWARRCAA